MSEAKALTFLFIGAFALAGLVGVVLTLMDVSGAVFGFVAVLLAGSGGFASSCVLMHYDRIKKREKRKELILSR